MIRGLRTLIFFLAGLFLVSCSQFSGNERADLNKIYGGFASVNQDTINPVIVIPGILGSRITDPVTQKSIWGSFEKDFLNPSQSQNLPIISLPLLGSNRPIRGIANGTLPSLRFRALGLSVQQTTYQGILQTLGIAGFRNQVDHPKNFDWGKDHFTCFEFSYDWRLSNAENSKALHQFILQKKRYIQAQSRLIYGKERPDLKFNIVAHSMGGLLARYYLRHGPQDLPADGSLPTLNWQGSQHVEKLIMVGTPNSGSLLSFYNLLDGQKFTPEWKRRLFSLSLPNFFPSILATYPSIYELLPRNRDQPVLNLSDNSPVDIYDASTWAKHGWGILNAAEAETLTHFLPEIPSPETRRAQATEHLQYQLTRAQQFHRSLDRPATPPPNLSISLIAGDAKVNPRQIKIDLLSQKRLPNDYGAGDGAVLRSSALADLDVAHSNQNRRVRTRLRSPIQFSNTIFLPAEHLELTRNTTFTNNLLYQLLLEP